MSNQVSEKGQLFTAEERGIFRYWNGREMVWGDPIAIEDALQLAAHGNLQTIVDQSAIGEQEGETAAQGEARRLYAWEKVRECCRLAFEMVPWNPKAEKPEEAGATAADCDRAFDAFLEFRDAKKKSGEQPTPLSEPSGSAG